MENEIVATVMVGSSWEKAKGFGNTIVLSMTFLKLKSRRPSSHGQKFPNQSMAIIQQGFVYFEMVALHTVQSLFSV